MTLSGFTTLIDYEALAASTLFEAPFRWAVARWGLDRTAAEALASSFPRGGFVHEERATGDKPYSLMSRPLVPFGATSPADDVSEVWRAVGAELTHSRYRDLVQHLARVPLDDATLEARLWRYEEGCWLAPHTDKEEKIVSQVFYFNDTWDPAWGGCLQILRSPHESDVAHEICPILGTVVTLVRSTTSWHAVPPVNNTDHRPPRTSLQVVFYRAGTAPREM